MLFDFANHRNFIDRDVSDLFVIVAQKQYAAFHVNHIAAKRRVTAA